MDRRWQKKAQRIGQGVGVQPRDQALGENRYMGGQNESSLNVDYALADAALVLDGRVIVAKGEVVTRNC